MTDDLRDALVLFEHYAEQPSSLPAKIHMEILCRGYAAATKGWRHIAENTGDETEILASLKEATIQLRGNEKRRRGPERKSLSAADQKVLRRYFDRALIPFHPPQCDPLDLSLRYFVEIAFDEGLYNGYKAGSVDVHINRLQRFLDRDD